MTYAHIDQAGVVSLPQVVEHGCFVQVGQTSHVLHLLKLWRVHLLSDVHIINSLLQLTNKEVAKQLLTTQQ